MIGLYLESVQRDEDDKDSLHKLSTENLVNLVNSEELFCIVTFEEVFHERWYFELETCNQIPSDMELMSKLCEIGVMYKFEFPVFAFNDFVKEENFFPPTDHNVIIFLKVFIELLSFLFIDYEDLLREICQILLSKDSHTLLGRILLPLVKKPVECYGLSGTIWSSSTK